MAEEFNIIERSKFQGSVTQTLQSVCRVLWANKGMILQALGINLLLYTQQYNLPFTVCNFTPSRKNSCFEQGSSIITVFSFGLSRTANSCQFSGGFQSSVTNTGQIPRMSSLGKHSLGQLVTRKYNKKKVMKTPINPYFESSPIRENLIFSSLSNFIVASYV